MGSGSCEVKQSVIGQKTKVRKKRVRGCVSQQRCWVLDRVVLANGDAGSDGAMLANGDAGSDGANGDARSYTGAVLANGDAGS